MVADYGSNMSKKGPLVFHLDCDQTTLFTPNDDLTTLMMIWVSG